MNNYEEKELYEKLWKNVEVVTIDGKQRIRCKYEYKRDVTKVFAPEKKDTTHIEREMAQPTMEPEVVAEMNQSVQSVEKGVNLHSR